MAETVKHTPGPWEFDGDNAVMAKVGAHICTVSMADDFPCLEDDQRADAEAECKANAYLIETAPELLSFLSALTGYVSIPGSEFRRRFPEFSKAMNAAKDHGERVQIICDHAGALVAKAEGRS